MVETKIAVGKELLDGEGEVVGSMNKSEMEHDKLAVGDGSDEVSTEFDSVEKRKWCKIHEAQNTSHPQCTKNWT